MSINQFEYNKLFISQEIEKKKSYTPILATSTLLYKTKTDMDQFPYQRFFRGKMYSDKPHIHEREAGFRLLDTKGYQQSCSTPTYIEPPYSTCFQNPCSTVLPCRKPPPAIATETFPIYISP